MYTLRTLLREGRETAPRTDNVLENKGTYRLLTEMLPSFFILKINGLSPSFCRAGGKKWGMILGTNEAGI
jgi:hypothetical protein